MRSLCINANVPAICGERNHTHAKLINPAWPDDIYALHCVPRLLRNVNVILQVLALYFMYRAIKCVVARLQLQACNYRTAHSFSNFHGCGDSHSCHNQANVIFISSRHAGRCDRSRARTGGTSSSRITRATRGTRASPARTPHTRRRAVKKHTHVAGLQPSPEHLRVHALWTDSPCFFQNLFENP